MSKTLRCINCEKEFRLGAWFNCEDNPARKHVVESKTYYSDSDSLQVQAIVETRVLGNNGNPIHIPGFIAQFHNGTFSTSDPQVQEVLDVRVPQSKEQWAEKRTTPELKAGRDRAIISQQQALIDELRAKNEELEAQRRENASTSEDADAVMSGAKGKSKAAKN